MVRISESLLPTNSSGVPQYEMTNTSVAITSAGTIDVSDSTAQGSLATIATNTSTSDSTLSNIDSTLSGNLQVTDSAANSTLSSIDSSLSGTLQVSSSVTINGSAGNLYNNTTVSSGTDSSIVSVSSKTKNTIYVTSDMGGEVRLYVRGTSAGGFHYHSSIYPQDPSGGMGGGGGGGGLGSVAYDGVLTLKDEVIDAIKLTATGTETITASVFSRI